jgi:hypothetical protein
LLPQPTSDEGNMTIAQSRLSPKEGDTKPCPQCRDHLVFNNRYAVLSVGLGLQRSAAAGGIHYERAWVCRNHRCDYRELLDEV